MKFVIQTQALSHDSISRGSLERREQEGPWQGIKILSYIDLDGYSFKLIVLVLPLNQFSCQWSVLNQQSPFYKSGLIGDNKLK